MTTERDMLDALWRRAGESHGTMPRRHVLAEQVRYDPTYGHAIADAISVDTWRSGHHALHGYEVKVSRSDYLREVRDPQKHLTWARHCERWWIVAPDSKVVGPADLPHGWGLLLLDRNGRLYQQRAALRRTDPDPLPLSAIAGLMRAAQQTADRHAAARVRAEYDGRLVACPIHADPCMECL